MLSAAHAEDQDIAGSKDSPLVSRFPGSIIQDYLVKKSDVFYLPIGPVGDNGPKTTPIEGKVTRIKYSYPSDISGIQVYRTYKSALQKSGFKTIYECDGSDCGISNFGPTESGWGETWYGGGHHQYSGKLSRASGDIYVNLHVNTDTAFLDIVEAKAMTVGSLTVNAAALASDIETSGHVAVYGVYFDTGKADIKPESSAALLEISKLLKQGSNLKLYVVGHTDNSGDLQGNVDLSRRRADSVLKVLETTYGINSDRLLAFGNGPYAPIASNHTEDGKAKNRRVELVER